MSDSKYYQRTIVKEQLDSTFLGMQRNLRVYLPPGYNELHSYPAIYCQDGEEFFNFGRIATHATRLILDEGLQPAIIVGVDVNMPERTNEYSPDGSRFGAYCQFFTKELLPFIEERYPVRPQPDDRILAGDSLGGTVSLHLVLDYPELFKKVLSLSGAFLPSTITRLQQEPDLSFLDIYMLIGTDETEVKTERGTFDFLQLNRETKEILERKNVRPVYLEREGKHIWGFWQKELPEALSYFLLS
ncbi:alpha/beta hydrolase [Marinicrinis lubricantis]|uniref:Alpha/beta hydrolase n=1 Tax=Marinicrinis lubricantis TaxID=2086470 RepID=A0ABW1IW75_9BACL